MKMHPLTGTARGSPSTIISMSTIAHPNAAQKIADNTAGYFAGRLASQAV